MDNGETEPSQACGPRPVSRPAGEAVYREVAPQSPGPSDNLGPIQGQTTRVIHPDILANRVCSSAGLVDRHDALDQLWQNSAKPMAEQVRSRYRHVLRPDFVDGAYGLLWQRLVDGKYDWRKGSFEGWWRTVLTNAATSAWRSARVAVPLSADHEVAANPRSRATEAALDQLSERLAELRTALDDLADRKELRAQVNYFAVLLLELRRVVVSRLRQSELLPGLNHLSADWAGLSDSQVIETLFPWRPAEEALAFRQDLAALGAIWDQLRPLIDAPPHDLAADVVCARIVSAGGQAITRAAWYNWKRHTKNKLGEVGFPGKWDDLI